MDKDVRQTAVDLNQVCSCHSILDFDLKKVSNLLDSESQGWHDHSSIANSEVGSPAAPFWPLVNTVRFYLVNFLLFINCKLDVGIHTFQNQMSSGGQRSKPQLKL